MPSATVAVVLAAGVGSRFLGPHHKLDAEIDGRSLLRRALDAARTSRIGPVLLVVGDDRDRPVRTVIPDDVVTVVNPTWRQGSATSLQAGIAKAAELAALRAVVALADQPFTTAAARGRCRRRRRGRGDLQRRTGPPGAAARRRLAAAADGG
jgi:molybdenum cofactor cytidylyltransferase